MVKTGIGAAVDVAPGERPEVAEDVGAEAAACERCEVEGWGAAETEGGRGVRLGAQAVICGSREMMQGHVRVRVRVCLSSDQLGAVFHFGL